MQEQSYMPTLIRLGKSFSWLIVNHICFSWFEREPQDDVNIQGLNTCEAVLVLYKVSKIKIRNEKTS